MRNTGILESNARIQVNKGRIQVSNARNQVSNIRIQASKGRIQASNARILESNAGIQVSNARIKLSKGRIQVNNACIEVSNAVQTSAQYLSNNARPHNSTTNDCLLEHCTTRRGQTTHTTDHCARTQSDIIEDQRAVPQQQRAAAQLDHERLLARNTAPQGDVSACPAQAQTTHTTDHCTRTQSDRLEDERAVPQQERAAAQLDYERLLARTLHHKATSDDAHH